MPRKIVVVDDDPQMRSLVTDALTGDFSILTAVDGRAGLDLVAKEVPDLVIVDFAMPHMHGFEVCRKIRENAALKGVKILMSSSKSYAHDINNAKQSGADAYLLKPYAIKDLHAAVEGLLGKPKVSLDLRFWGTRGSLPAPGPKTQRYGGNTSCTELRIGGELFIIDAGSGIRELGNSLMQERKGAPINGHILLGHTHWDHIQGFPFFTPLYVPGNKFKVYGVHRASQTFEEAMKVQMSPDFFPVSLGEMGSHPEIVDINGPLQIGPATVTTHYLNHPGVTIGFRIQTKDWTVSYISDHESYGKLNAKGDFSANEDAQVAKFVEDSDILICEAQYTDEEYRSKKSWGHSTFSDVLDLAFKARAKQLILFHHDPSHTDEMMDRFVDECRLHIAKSGRAMACSAAQEGMSLAL